MTRSVKRNTVGKLKADVETKVEGITIRRTVPIAIS